MEGLKKVNVTQQASESSSVNKEAAQPIEPVYTVPPEEQTQFEACNPILQPYSGQTFICS
jgi:hypothetical protein